MIDNIVPFAQLYDLACVLVPKMLEIDLKPTCGHGELRPQQVFVELDFLHRLRKGGAKPPRGKTHCPIVSKRQNCQANEGRKQKTDPHIHHRFDHISETVNLVV